MSEKSERDELIEILGEIGVSPDDVPENPGDAVALASDIVIARHDYLSLHDLEEEVGVEPDAIGSLFTHLGIKVEARDAILFNQDDVELGRFLLSAVTDVLTEKEGIEILHVAGTALSTVADAAVAGHVQGPERRAESFAENARLNVRIAELGLVLSSQLATVFRHHLRQAAHINRRNQSLTHRELVSFTVGFLDLVGFTYLSQSLEVSELVELVKSFETQAHELAHLHDARIVKLIGDEVMVVAEHPASAAAFVLGMIDAFEDGDVVPRGGLAAGDVISIHGDFFGPVVNLAARLVDSAVPGEVLVDDEVAQADDVSSEPAGRRMLKGFDDPIRVHTLLQPATTL